MTPPEGWQNPINVDPGEVQADVDPTQLLPSRPSLIQQRLDCQRALAKSGRDRLTPILVNKDGVIFDGHHAIRVAAEEGNLIRARVVDFPLQPTARSILELPIG